MIAVKSRYMKLLLTIGLVVVMGATGTAASEIESGPEVVLHARYVDDTDRPERDQATTLRPNQDVAIDVFVDGVRTVKALHLGFAWDASWQCHEWQSAGFAKELTLFEPTAIGAELLLACRTEIHGDRLLIGTLYMEAGSAGSAIRATAPGKKASAFLLEDVGRHVDFDPRAMLTAGGSLRSLESGVTDTRIEAAQTLITGLGAAWPNPAHGSSRIAYSLGQATEVRLAIYDLRGRLVRTLVDRSEQPGSYRIAWDGRDGNGRNVSAGVYLYRLNAGATTQQSKLLVIR